MPIPVTRRGWLLASSAAGGALAALGIRGRHGKDPSAMDPSSTPDRPGPSISPRGLLGVERPGPRHWVGDGFDVQTVFWPQRSAQATSPFLLLDFGARRRFEPARRRRGVGEHPHRGFETVTFVYQGEVEHRDSGGGGGTIGAGDIQWMTAGAGVVHEEFHSQAMTERGGDFEVVQLWVNLPARLKMTAPRYQPIRDADLPRLELGSAVARLVAGTIAETTGPAQTHTPMLVLDGTFRADGQAQIPVPRGWNALVLGLEGGLGAGAEGERLPQGHFARFAPEDGGPMVLSGRSGARFLALAGAPIREPVAAHGPFVMNRRDEIVRAFEDYQSGRMGHLAPRGG